MSLYQMEHGSAYAGMDEGVARFIGKVYGTLAICMMASTAICAFAVANIQAFYPIAGVSRWILLGMILVSCFVRLSGPLAWAYLAAFVSLISVMIAPMIYSFTRTTAGTMTVASALGLTAAIFLVLTAYVRISGKSFTFMGGILWVSTLALIITGIALMFFPSKDAHYWLSCVSAVIFSGWILYDTSAVTEIHYPNNNVPGAVLNLYVDLVNLFLNLLSILRGRD